MTTIFQKRSSRDAYLLEAMLITLAIGISFLLYRMGAFKMVVLNLFYLPTVLAGYYLGRTNAGILALFSVLAATIAVMLDAVGFAAFTSPVMVGLALTVWGGCLGLTAILLGTLCDERAQTVRELHAAYVGVVEVLSKYLQSANPKVKARATRVAELGQDVAFHMRLSQREVDDIRVAALLYDLGNIEITTRLLSKAVDTLEASPEKFEQNTFSGMDLVHSLGSVLNSALPILLNQDDATREALASEDHALVDDPPLGAKIINAVRAYDAFTHGLAGRQRLDPDQALAELRNDVTASFDAGVLDALEQVIQSRKRSESKQLAHA